MVQEKKIKEAAASSRCLRWLFANLSGYGALYALGMILTVVYNGMQLTVPIFSQKIVDLFLSGKESAAVNLELHRDWLLWLLAGMVGLTFLRTFLVYHTCMIFERVSQGMLYRIRNRLFRKILNQDMGFYDRYRTGDLMTRLTGDLDAVRHMVAWVVRTVIECVSLLLSAAIYFIYLDPIMAVSILALSPLIFFVTLAFKRQVAPMHQQLREKMSELNTAAQENISGNRVVKAFARERYEIERFQERNEDYSKARKETSLLWLKYYPVIELCADALPVILMVLGGFFLMRGRLSFGEYVAYSGLLWTVANPMRNLGNIINEFQRFHSAVQKVMELDAAEPVIVSAAPSGKEETLRGRVEFRNVSFSYGEREVLHRVNLTVEAGQTVAIMGETGSGKTSLIQLIPRFYDPQEGEVLVDGKNVKDWELKKLRGHIGMATQDVLLFSDSIDGNIAYGDSKMPASQVEYFARSAAAAEFIERMLDRYETIVGERGVGLSGGQKQRISLARALAIRPAILILDDTTSAVDLETEKHIQDSLSRLDFPCTKIIIAQRISSAKDADRIFVLEHGVISEQGTHAELLAKQGYYYQVAMLQNGGEQVG